MSYTKQHAKQRKLVAAMLAALACLVLSGWLGWRLAPVAAANSGKSLDKIVNLDRQFRLDAVTITKVTVAGQQIQPGKSGGVREEERGTPFQADEDWLKNMSISLLNRTDKVIVCAQVQFFFPDTGDGVSQPITTYTITVGQRPESSLYYADGSKIPPDTTKKPLLFAPGQTLVIPVADYVDAIQSTVEEKIPLSQITKVNIRRANFYFVDGMRWDSVYTGYYAPDSDHPGKYTKLAPNYFPGHVQNRPSE
jgi:hypothetical protein